MSRLYRNARRRSTILLAPCLFLVGAACQKAPERKAEPVVSTKEAAPPVPLFQVDPKTASTVKGTVVYRGPKPKRRAIDMSEEPACVEAHHGKAYEEPLVVDKAGRLANAFVYVKSGLEGKHFAIPDAPVTIDQNGCGFHPRVLGIQVGQRLNVTNSDPLTHNIHPLAQVNREWNHSQGPGDPPLARKFLKPEIMIRVKCNIHSWMRAYIGVTDHPYFAVSGADGSFELPNLPPGTYVVEAWQEELGVQDKTITVSPSTKTDLSFTFSRGK
jgi:plastocyanin